eukprot:SAG31_NODE_3467_length_4242_cov_1.967415_5_plen_157_part_00
MAAHAQSFAVSMPTPPASSQDNRPADGLLPQHVPRERTGISTPGAIGTVVGSAASTAHLARARESRTVRRMPCICSGAEKEEEEEEEEEEGSWRRGRWTARSAVGAARSLQIKIVKCTARRARIGCSIDLQLRTAATACTLNLLLYLPVSACTRTY